MRVVLDTNVLVSALLTPTGKAAAILMGAATGKFRPCYDYKIFKEYQEVLSRDKFRLSPDRIDDALSVIRDYGLNLERTKVEGEVFPDPKDVVFYEVAMSKEDAYLVTGNIKHFPKKPFVVTPAEMIAIIEADNR